MQWTLITWSFSLREEYLMRTSAMYPCKVQFWITYQGGVVRTIILPYTVVTGYGISVFWILTVIRAAQAFGLMLILLNVNTQSFHFWPHVSISHQCCRLLSEIVVQIQKLPYRCTGWSNLKDKLKEYYEDKIKIIRQIFHEIPKFLMEPFYWITCWL